jgi:hypothetical protein
LGNAFFEASPLLSNIISSEKAGLVVMKGMWNVLAEIP